MLKWLDLNEFRKVDQPAVYLNRNRKRIMIEDIAHQNCQYLKKMNQLFVATDQDSVPVPGRIIHTRSYEVQTPSVVVRRNRSYIYSCPEEASTSEPDPEPNSSYQSPVII